MSTEVYRALKNEQTTRVYFRDAAAYLTVFLYLSIITADVSSKITVSPFLILFISWAMYSLYAINDYYVSRFSIYFETMPGAFREWESFRSQTIGHTLQKILRRFVELSVFVFSPLYLISQVFNDGHNTFSLLLRIEVIIFMLASFVNLILCFKFIAKSVDAKRGGKDEES